jgi:hypothetical protein
VTKVWLAVGAELTAEQRANWRARAKALVTDTGTTADVRLHRILALRSFGFALADIGQQLAEMAERRRRFREQISPEQLAEMQRHRAHGGTS